MVQNFRILTDFKEIQDLLVSELWQIRGVLILSLAQIVA